MPPDLTNIQVMRERVRRAIEGPYGALPGLPALSDEQIDAATADAVADAILYTNGGFGHTLIVLTRDEDTGAPTAWATEEMLEEWEVSIIAAVAAYNSFFQMFRDSKTSSSITGLLGEKVEWSTSANLVVGQMKALREQMLAAFAAAQSSSPVLARYASILAVRDRYTEQVVEDWTRLNPVNAPFSGLGGGQEASVVPWTP